MLKNYLTEIIATSFRGDAREESYYHLLAALLTEYTAANGNQLAITILPKKTEGMELFYRRLPGL